MFRLKKRKQRGNLIAAVNYLIGLYKEDGARLFLKVQCLRMRDSEHKQQYGKFFCAVKMTEYQNRLLRQLSPSLEINLTAAKPWATWPNLKTDLSLKLSLLWTKWGYEREVGVDQVTFRSSFWSKLFYEYAILLSIHCELFRSFKEQRLASLGCVWMI